MPAERLSPCSPAERRARLKASFRELPGQFQFAKAVEVSNAVRPAAVARFVSWHAVLLGGAPELSEARIFVSHLFVPFASCRTFRRKSSLHRLIQR